MDTPLALVAFVLFLALLFLWPTLPQRYSSPSSDPPGSGKLCTTPTDCWDQQLGQRNEAGSAAPSSGWLLGPALPQDCLGLNLCQELMLKRTTQSSCPVTWGVENFFRIWDGAVTWGRQNREDWRENGLRTGQTLQVLFRCPLGSSVAHRGCGHPLNKKTGERLSRYDQGRDGPQLTLHFLTRCEVVQDVWGPQVLLFLEMWPKVSCCTISLVMCAPTWDPALPLCPASPVCSAPLAAGKCLRSVSGFPCSEVPQGVFITPDLVQLRACLHQLTEGSWGSIAIYNSWKVLWLSLSHLRDIEFLGLGHRASGSTETRGLSTALAVIEVVPSASW